MTRAETERLTAWIEQTWARMERENPTQTITVPPGAAQNRPRIDEDGQGDLFRDAVARGPW